MTFTASLDGVGDRLVSRDRVRTVRMQRHLAVAGLACMAGTAMLPTVRSFWGFMALNAFVFVVLSSLAKALDARLGQWWGWLYGEPEYTTRLDRLVDTFLSRLGSAPIGHASATRSDVDSAHNEPKIRILPPGPDHR